MARQMVQTIEEHSLNAWPALHQLLYDGWVLRFSDGYTKRANSVNVLHPSQQKVATKVERCIALYHRQNLPTIFRITPLAQVEQLEPILDDLGFSQESLTSVQTMDLALFADETTPNFHYWTNDSTEWEAHYVRLAGIPAQRETHQRMLQNIIPHTCFATIQHQGVPVACGLGVLEGEYVGLFDIVTDVSFRQQGYGYQLVHNILHWAKIKGAKQAYLQVEQKNFGAIKLYKKLGFTEIYPYWYRTLSLPE